MLLVSGIRQCNSKTEQLSLLIGHDDDLHLQTGSCDFFRGRWVRDDSYPLYNSTSCPFIMKEFDCQKNGRPDIAYLKFRWKPHRCKLPRFNGRDFLRRFKGKRILFVGDSLSLNQWKSLTCMLHVSVPQTNYTLKRNGALSTFTLQEYCISVALSRNGFLVDLVKEKMGAILKLDSINNGNAWKGYDMLIFNTWHWWLHTGRNRGITFNKEIEYTKIWIVWLLLRRGSLLGQSGWTLTLILKSPKSSSKEFLQPISRQLFSTYH
ncbi:hypothetical protein CIPAW_12G112300 [Carya illinoinensis]|uniref:Trichome birefringence-like N-terminal domain-containing protein n=1 Tax=Carya illinoinensis TaxID=32201 RepID=A0A8T1NW12_CARIL|nr:hypothetical protein CIPAW_12G112300 [Carya illinoinensis]